MKLLYICNPDRYPRPSSDIPIFYRQVAGDRRVDFFHVPTQAVLEREVREGLTVAAVREPMEHQDFLALDGRARSRQFLEAFDLVFCRTLKPFPDGYLDRLALWEPHVRFANSPTGKKRQTRADFLLGIARDYMPETIVTDDDGEALAFFEKYGTAIAKRVNSCGGRGVFKIEYRDGGFQADHIERGARSFATFSQLLNALRGGVAEPLQFSRYLTRVTEGDKRVIVVGGEIYGAFLRRSRSGHWVNNISGDGECLASEVGATEREAIEKTVGFYRDLGLFTLGYDFLRDEDGTWRIGEINAGNIGGFARLEALTGRPVWERLISWLIGFSRSER